MCKFCNDSGNVLAYRKTDDKNSNEWNQYAFNCSCGSSERRGYKAPKWVYADHSKYFLEKPTQVPNQPTIPEPINKHENTHLQFEPEVLDDCPF